MSRAVIWAGVLVASGLAVWFAPSETGPVVVQAVARQAAPEAARGLPARAQGSPAVGSVRARVPDEADVPPVFAPAGWADKPAPVQPVPQAPLAVVAAPVATPEGPPPLPFKLLGSLWEDGQPMVFLQWNEQNLVVRAGDRIAGQYVVEKLDEAALTVLHLPTNQRQSLGLAPSR